MEIIRSADPANTAGAELSTLLQHYADTPTLLLLSGGSALTILDHVAPDTLSPLLTITTLDERFSPDPSVNNFTQVTATDFYQSAREKGAKVIDTSVQADDTLDAAAARFEQALKDWRNLHPQGCVIATMGVGPDGHTAGIFPHQVSNDPNISQWVVAETVPPDVNPHAERFTVTPTFLRQQVTHVIGYVVGETKLPVLTALQTDHCDQAHMPACILRELPVVTIVTDLE